MELLIALGIVTLYFATGFTLASLNHYYRGHTISSYDKGICFLIITVGWPVSVPVIFITKLVEFLSTDYLSYLENKRWENNRKRNIKKQKKEIDAL